MIVSRLSWVKSFFIGTWQFFASVVVVFFVFLGQFHDFKSPDVVLEVTAVSATSSQPVDLIKFPELSALKFLVGDEDFISLSGASREHSPDEIERLLLIYKNKIATATTEIDRAEKNLGAAISGANAKEIEARLNALDDELTGLPRSLFLLSSARSAKEAPEITGSQMLEKLKSRVNEMLEAKRKERDSMLSKYKEASKQWSEFKSVVMPSRTKLVVTCAVGNQGSGATSLKPQALFRANLGEGNYLDFPMKMSGYDSSPEAATLQSQSYKVIKFESDEIQSMTAADRERFKSFLGNASPAKIFVSDVRGEVYASNSVPFSPGVYEQKMFDSLKQFASSKTFR
ncbi:hypothetical protein [Pseudomonas sp. Q11]|uniref:hypothetical protein n=1 Tax=Pseudomonas sp. Q11 TaxID=2968470 RepID=UPI00210A0F28|nr:hypothetical protein [Pseudomonas sp. Q11]MCQ6255999.1 hypothetical protein [Pseudomonas sp. Q11]